MTLNEINARLALIRQQYRDATGDEGAQAGVRLSTGLSYMLTIYPAAAGVSLPMFFNADMAALFAEAAAHIETLKEGKGQ